MGRDNQPKHRQIARDLRRRSAVRQPFPRLLIVCEGEKTEPQYLTEICRDKRLPTAHVHVCGGARGTEPRCLVDYAERLFLEGDRGRHLEPRRFDGVYVVFDRDVHHSYHEALHRVAALHRRLKNDERQAVEVHAVASVPCFELWLLLHYEDVQAPLHRDEACRRLRRHLPGYEKGRPGLWAMTRDHLDAACRRAQVRALATTAHDGREPYTDMAALVQRLLNLAERPAF